MAEHKHTKKEAKYEDPAKMADKCRDCHHFRTPRACTKVQGDIAPGAWCKYFERF